MSTLARRVERLERAQPALTAVLGWLAEAHGFDTHGAYVSWRVRQPDVRGSLPRRAQEACDAAVAALAQGSGEVALVVHQTRSDVCFLVNLVETIDGQIEHLVMAGSLRIETIASDLRLIGLEVVSGASPEPTSVRTVAARYLDWCSSFNLFARSLDAMEAGRRALQDRFLAGEDALYPETARLWSSLLAEVETLAEQGRSGSFAPVQGHPVRWPPHWRGAQLLAPDLRREQVESLRAAAVRELSAAATAATRWSLGQHEAAQVIEERHMAQAAQWSAVLHAKHHRRAPARADGRRGARQTGGARDKRWKGPPAQHSLALPTIAGDSPEVGKVGPAQPAPRPTSGLLGGRRSRGRQARRRVRHGQAEAA
jgi:hypothetical protein